MWYAVTENYRGLSLSSMIFHRFITLSDVHKAHCDPTHSGDRDERETKPGKQVREDDTDIIPQIVPWEPTPNRMIC